MEEPIRRVGDCPHCGNHSPQRLVHYQQYYERSWLTSDGSESDPCPWSSFVAVCETCGHVLVYDNTGDTIPQEQFSKCALAYPDNQSLHSSVPKLIAEVYDEAIRIKERAPNAFAVQVRRALEALCEDKGATGRDLQKKLAHLAANGHIPPVLAEASDALRLIGNVGAHGVGESVHPLLANAINDFFRAIVEYVYVAPSKLEEFRKAMTRFSKKPQEPA